MFRSSLLDATQAVVPSDLEAVNHSVMVVVVLSAVEAAVRLVLEDVGPKLIMKLKTI